MAALHFEGDNEFLQPPAELFARLSDARFLVSCLPDVESTTKTETTAAECVVRPGFSFVRGSIQLTLKVAEAVADKSLRILAHGKSIGASNDLELNLNLAPKDSGTRVHWTADITNLTGLLKLAPQGLLKGAAQKVINDVWEAVRKKLGAV